MEERRARDGGLAGSFVPMPSTNAPIVQATAVALNIRSWLKGVAVYSGKFHSCLFRHVATHYNSTLMPSLPGTAVQDRQKSSDPCCQLGLCVPGTAILRSS